MMGSVRYGTALLVDMPSRISRSPSSGPHSRDPWLNPGYALLQQHKRGDNLLV